MSVTTFDPVNLLGVQEALMVTRYASKQPEGRSVFFFVFLFLVSFFFPPSSSALTQLSPVIPDKPVKPVRGQRREAIMDPEASERHKQGFSGATNQ